MPIPPKVKAGCGAAMVFFAGVFCGFLGLILLIAFLGPRSEGWKSPESKEFLVKHFAKQLKLTEAQKETLRPGFERFLDRRWKLRSEYLGKDKEILEGYYDEIEGELTPQQAEKYHEIVERWWKDKKDRVAMDKAAKAIE